MTSRLYFVFWALLSLAAFAPLAAAVYDAATPVQLMQSRSVVEPAVPLIRAPEEPIKVRPIARSEEIGGPGKGPGKGPGMGNALGLLHPLASASERVNAEPPPPLPPALERAFRHALANPPERPVPSGR